jgi:hypothetical protein
MTTLCSVLTVFLVVALPWPGRIAVLIVVWACTDPPAVLLAAHRRGLARLARERRRRAGLDADGVRLVGAATPGKLPPAISSPACRTQRPSS